MRTKNRRIKVVETGKIYQSVEECAQHIGGSAVAIKSVLAGRQNRHKGYTFALAGKRGKENSSVFEER